MSLFSHRMKTASQPKAKRRRPKASATRKPSWPVPVPLTWIESVPEHTVNVERIKGFSASHLLFEVLLHQCADPIRLDARVMPYRILDGRHRIFIARQRRLLTVPVLIEVPLD